MKKKGGVSCILLQSYAELQPIECELFIWLCKSNSSQSLGVDQSHKGERNIKQILTHLNSRIQWLWDLHDQSNLEKIILLLKINDQTKNILFKATSVPFLIKYILPGFDVVSLSKAEINPLYKLFWKPILTLLPNLWLSRLSEDTIFAW